MHRPRAVNYLLAIVIVAIAAVLTNLEWPLIKPEVTPLLLAGIMLSAWLGGLGPGLLATLLSAAVVEYLTTPPGERVVLDLADLHRLGLFVAASASISWLNAVRRRAEGRSRAAYVEANSANIAKDHFLAVLSHELRNPLTPALLLTETRRADRALPEDVRADFETLHRNVQLEARLVDDLLDVTRIAHGKLALRLESVDVHRVLGDALRGVDEAARSKGLLLQSDLHARDHFVRGDAARLAQVFLNLLRNAIKFTPAGGRIAVQTRNAISGELLIEVADTGIGIEPQAMTRIFNAFEQGDGRVTQNFGGLGLGLTISQGLVTAHGGRIRATSEGKDRGATFIAELPTVSKPVQQTSAPPKPPARGNDSALRILLVEDHADTAALLCRLLRRHGYTVRTAASVESTLQLASAEPFDLVISDLGLPDGSGLELMRELRKKYPMRGIALTGYGTEEDVRQAHEAGFAAHLTKPVSVERLEETIRSMGG